jgi:hypothetical protein
MICNYAKFCWTKVAAKTFYNAKRPVEGGVGGPIAGNFYNF